jgi:disulfide bond formation protein DsbB
MIFLGCAGLLGFGYYLELVKGIEPCPLCLIQRAFFALAGLTGLIAAIHNPATQGTRIYSVFMAIFSIAGGSVAGRQVWLQHLPKDQVPECGPGLEYMLQAYPFGDVLTKVFKGSGECAEVGWTFLGLSIAEWALACFILLTITSVCCGVSKGRAKPRVFTAPPIRM